MLVDDRDGRPIAPIGIHAHDGRLLTHKDLHWRDRSELEAEVTELGQARAV